MAINWSSLLVTCLAAAGIGGLHIPSPELAQSSQKSDGSPRAVLPVTSFDFGDVYKGEKISYVFIVKNVGNADLLIKELVPTCGCEVTEADRVIPPGREGKAIIEVNTASQVGQIEKIATLRTSDPNLASTNLTLIAHVLTGPGGGPVENVTLRTGKHVGPLFVSPETRWGFKAELGKSARFEFTVTVEKGTVHLKTVETESDHVKCGIETVEEGKRYKIVVDSLPLDTPARIENEFRVYTDSAQLPWFSLALSLRVAKGP